MRRRAFRVGILGGTEQALLTALTMRDYGHHSVVGLGLDGVQTSSHEANSLLDALPIPACQNTHQLVAHADMVFYFADIHPADLFEAVWVQNRLIPPFLVVPSATSPRWRHDLSRMAPPRCRVASMDLSARSPTELACPSRIHAEIIGGGGVVADAIEALWRPIVNTVPFTWAPAPEVSETGLPWSSPASWTQPGVSTPPA